MFFVITQKQERYQDKTLFAILQDLNLFFNILTVAIKALVSWNKFFDTAIVLIAANE